MERKTADPTKYMREYKKKMYEEDPEKILASNKKYYYKTKFGLTKEDANIFGDLIVDCGKILHHFAVIKEKKPHLIAVLLAKI